MHTYLDVIWMLCKHLYCSTSVLLITKITSNTRPFDLTLIITQNHFHCMHVCGDNDSISERLYPGLSLHSLQCMIESFALSTSFTAGAGVGLAVPLVFSALICLWFPWFPFCYFPLQRLFSLIERHKVHHCDLRCCAVRANSPLQ